MNDREKKAPQRAANDNKNYLRLCAEQKLSPSGEPRTYAEAFARAWFESKKKRWGSEQLA